VLRRGASILSIPVIEALVVRYVCDAIKRKA
jgi:hypothetical protein